jgi:hypothetical protein
MNIPETNLQKVKIQHQIQKHPPNFKHEITPKSIFKHQKTKNPKQILKNKTKPAYP